MPTTPAQTWLSGPGEEVWRQIEARVQRGELPYDAARAENVTLSALKRGDASRHARLLEASKAARAETADRVVERHVVEPDEQGELRFTDESSDALRQAWMRRWQPLYASQQLSVSGSLEVVSPELESLIERLTAPVVDGAAAGRTAEATGGGFDGIRRSTGEGVAAVDGAAESGGAGRELEVLAGHGGSRFREDEDWQRVDQRASEIVRQGGVDGQGRE